MHIIIIGAGFAGIEALRQLQPIMDQATISVFDKNRYATMIPSLPDCALNVIAEKYLQADIKKLIGSDVFFYQEEIIKIDLDAQTIHSQSHDYYYDYLIVSAGSVVNFYKFNQNIEKVHFLDSLDSARKLGESYKRFLSTDRKEYQVVISGGGFTGVELAANMAGYADSLGKNVVINIVEFAKTPLLFLSDSDRRYVQSFLDYNNISIETNVQVDSFDGENVLLSNGKSFNSPFFCWSAGVRCAIPKINGTIEQTYDKRIMVNQYLQPGKYDNVFVAGDCAAVSWKGNYLRRAVNFAVGSGVCAGVNCVHSITKKRLKRFVPHDLGWVLPLGSTSVGRMLSIVPLRGKIGLCLHYLMCGYRSFTFRNFVFYVLFGLKRAMVTRDRQQGKSTNEFTF